LKILFPYVAAQGHKDALDHMDHKVQPMVWL